MNTCPVAILAGGLGTRLRSQITDRPKALAPVAGKPFLEWQLALLARHGFTRFVLCVGYLAEQIRACLGGGSNWGVDIEYSVETEPLGTAGAIKNAASYFTSTVLVLNGDTYLDINYQEMLAHHRKTQAYQNTLGTLALVRVDDQGRYGSVGVDASGMITGFSEKDRDSSQGWVNAGAYVIEPNLLDHIPAFYPVSLERQVFPGLVSPVPRLSAFQTEGMFVDIGTPEGYQRLQKVLER